jgi:hypothetical protein
MQASLAGSSDTEHSYKTISMTSEEIVRGRWHYLRIVMQQSTAVCIFAAEFALLKVLSNEIDLAESGISRKDRLH